MASTDVKGTVFRVVAKQFAIREDRITASTSLQDDLGADSAAMVELLINLEEAFDSEMPDVSKRTIRTVGEIVDFIVEVQASAQAS
jgi:acyl carrier protein